MMAGFGLLWIVLVLGAAYFGFRYLQRRDSGGTSPFTGRASEAEDILKERYARGEIGREEYETMLRELRR